MITYVTVPVSSTSTVVYPLFFHRRCVPGHVQCNKDERQQEEEKHKERNYEVLSLIATNKKEVYYLVKVPEKFLYYRVIQM